MAAALIAVLLSAPPTASAQLLEDRFGGAAPGPERADTAATLPADGTCPATEGDGSEEQKDFRRRPIEAPRQVILPDVQLFRDVDLSTVVDGIKAPFQSYVRVLRWDEGPLRSHLVKIDTALGPKCGWIERAALLARERTKPIQIKDLRADVRQRFGKLSDISTLDAKVLVRNRFDDIDDATTTGARVYYRFSDPEPYDTLRIFNVLSVFDYAEYGGELWYFVGGERDHEGSGTKLHLLGWVRADELIEWSSRMNLSPRSGAGGLPVYPNIGAAYDGQSWFAKTREQAVPVERVVPPYPLLESWHQAGGAALHRIAFPATACTSDGECISVEEFAVMRSEISDEVWEWNKIDFLFVIDATEGMQRHFGLVVQGIEEFLNDIDPADRENVRFSVVVYGDFLDRTGQDFQFARVIPFGSADIDKRMDALLRADSFVDNMHDMPDAGFAALIKAIDEADWREDAGWKMVTWVGDHPSRSDELTGNRPPLFTEADVARSIERIGNGVWSAINVRGRYDAAHNELFMTQAGRILEQRDGRGLPPRRAYAEGGGSETDADVVQAVRENLHGILKAGKGVPRVMKMLAADEDLSEEDLEMPNDLDTASAVLSQYVRENLSMSDEDIRRFFKRSQLVREGWVRQNPDAPDWRYWISLEWDELDDLVEASEALCGSLSDGAPDFNRVLDAMVAMLEAVSGDRPQIQGRDEDANIQTFLSKRLHVPLARFSPLLAQSPDDFVRWYINSPLDEVENFQIDVCKKSALLRMVKSGRRVDGGVEDIAYDTRLREWTPLDGKVREYEWTWGTEQGIRYYYVPLDYIL